MKFPLLDVSWMRNSREGPSSAKVSALTPATGHLDSMREPRHLHLIHRWLNWSTNDVVILVTSYPRTNLLLLCAGHPGMAGNNSCVVGKQEVTRYFRFA